MAKKRKGLAINIGEEEIAKGLVRNPDAGAPEKQERSPIPIESLRILMTGDSNDKFRVVTKKMNTRNVKLVLKHRETGDQVKITVPISFLEFHKIAYKFPKAPTNHQIEGVLQDKVRAWEVITIITDLAVQADVVVVKDLGSDKTIACKVPTQDIENTKHYIDKCRTYAQSTYNLESINIWRETEWQREIMTKVNLLRLTRSQTLQRV